MNATAIQYWFNFYSARSFLPEINARQYIKKELIPILYVVVFPIIAPKRTLAMLSPFDLPKLIYVGTLN